MPACRPHLTHKKKKKNVCMYVYNFTFAYVCIIHLPLSGKSTWLTTILWASIPNLVSSCTNLSVSYKERNSGIHTHTKVVLSGSLNWEFTLREAGKGIIMAVVIVLVAFLVTVLVLLLVFILP